MSKKLIIFVTGFLIIVGTTICCFSGPGGGSNDDKQSPEPPTPTPTIQGLLLGDWETQDGTTKISFDKSGTFRRNIDKTGKESGTYKIQDGNLYLVIEGQEAELKIEFRSENSLSIETETGEKMEFERIIP